MLTAASAMSLTLRFRIQHAISKRNRDCCMWTSTFQVAGLMVCVSASKQQVLGRILDPGFSSSGGFGSVVYGARDINLDIIIYKVFARKRVVYVCIWVRP